jgi:predicted Holliday junction resolvase-like endonuclease
VSPGIWGFVAFFVLAVALYLLMRNMNARMRKMSYRAEELQREAEREANERKARKEGRGVSEGQDSEPPAPPAEADGPRSGQDEAP